MVGETHKRHKPEHPPYKQMVKEALDTESHQGQGLSVSAMKHFISEHYGEHMSAGWEKRLLQMIHKMEKEGNLRKHKSHHAHYLWIKGSDTPAKKKRSKKKHEEEEEEHEEAGEHEEEEEEEHEEEEEEEEHEEAGEHEEENGHEEEETASPTKKAKNPTKPKDPKRVAAGKKGAAARKAKHDE